MKLPVVLNTRPREQAAELSRLLEAAGYLVAEAPAIAVVSSWAASDLERVRRELANGDYTWVVLASQNAGRDLVADLRGTKIVCGAATAQALGLEAAVGLERFSASTALEALHPLLSPRERVLVPRAAEGRDELVLGLAALRVRLDAPTAYRTVPVADAAERLRDGGIDVVTLCSPSAAHSVAQAITPRMAVVCLGETTATAAREAGVRVDAVARITTMAALVDAVRLVLGQVSV